MKRWAGVGVALTVLVGCRDASSPELPVGSPLFSHFAAGTWTNTRTLSIGRHFLAAAAAASDGRVFLSGGLDEGGSSLTLVEAYNPDDDAWTTVAPLPEDRYSHASVRAGDGLIYVLGGVTGGSTVTSSVAVYDPTFDTWSPLSTGMSIPRGGPAAAVAGGKIYVTGGATVGPSENQVVASGEFYDPDDPTAGWKPIASMLTPRVYHAMATGSDGRIYAIGGTDRDDFTGGFIASVEAYDPARDDLGWTEVASLPAGRWGLGAATAVDGHIYAFGGMAEGGVERTVLMYETGATAWPLAPLMNQARFLFAATAGPDGRIYAIAGLSELFGNLNSAEWYLLGAVTTVAIDIKPGGDPNSINRKSNGKVPVAVLSSSTFHATAIDRSTVVFASAPALLIGGGVEDVNGDGLPDAVFHFATPALELPDGTTEACLTGNTTGGISFQGCDNVRLVK